VIDEASIASTRAAGSGALTLVSPHATYIRMPIAAPMTVFHPRLNP
jgi:hypothetical protein